ncbi:Phosphoenolpyruvate/pyruvate domain-containing protein [Hyaloscypha variabilis F]|uniref:Phosphoenolpyruvate/pyruvate domain-containing protein n=1 Tax=Hyaloscypha variabilis (strain UAMH 11265 / GT02V1 / F) TaxID=1149755 RepID=A0A2J6QTN5_HYAVF|nr:Phosphoenolpyruvate/pyruvate domain-containing protein [Hyaloscypha variabilis F]
MPFLGAATKLRRFLEQSNKILLCPGVYDGFSARIALSVGFDALYMTGAGTTASRLGEADLGIATQSDMRAHAEMIANLDPSIPLIADADTGYGGPIMVARTVEQYARSGVAGLHIEDQVQTKRCGHLRGKELVDLNTFSSRIRAGVAARKRIGSDILIIARTDSLQGLGYEEAIRRLKTVRDLGADAGFLEGMTSIDMFKKAVAELAPWPLLLNMVEGSVTPTISVEEAETFGFRLIIHPLAAMCPAYVAIKEGLEKLKRTGRMDHDPKLTPQFIFNVCGLEESMELDAEAGGSSFAQKP